MGCHIETPQSGPWKGSTLIMCGEAFDPPKPCNWHVERALILRELPVDAWPEEWIADAQFPERRGWPCRAYRTLGARTALVEFFDGTAVFTAAAHVRERSAGTNPLREAL